MFSVPSRWDLEYDCTCAAYTVKLVFQMNVHTHTLLFDRIDKRHLKLPLKMLENRPKDALGSLVETVKIVETEETVATVETARFDNFHHMRYL